MNVIIWKNYGQLGNRLLTFSNVISIGISRGWSVYNPSFKEFGANFEYFKPQLIPHYCANRQPRLVQNLANSNFLWKIIISLLQKKRLLAALHSANILLDSDDLTNINIRDLDLRLKKLNKKFLVWSAWNLSFKEVRDKYRSELVYIFRPSESIACSVKSAMCQFSRSNLVIGVHLRRGDYASFADGIYFFPFELYRKLMLRLMDIYGSTQVQFAIFSNERVPNAMLAGLPAISMRGSTMEDLYCLAKCDLIVGPPSTFSEWASFYGGAKRIVFTGELPCSI